MRNSEIQVWSSFTNSWVGGFELENASGGADDRTFVVRRRSDGYVLPEAFPADAVRLPASLREAVEGD